MVGVGQRGRVADKWGASMVGACRPAVARGCMLGRARGLLTRVLRCREGLLIM